MEKIFKFVCCGNVDDGKSTLLGRLMFDLGKLKKDQIEDAIRASKKYGSKELEYSMFLDGLLEERGQQITIDVAHRYFDHENIRFHILDCPGHEQYTGNMAIACSQANTAVLVIDINKLITEQTKKHLEICGLFQIQNLIVCLNKCDTINWDKKKIDFAIREIEKFLFGYRFDYKIIPVSALNGDNIVKSIIKGESVIDSLVKYARDEKKERGFVCHIQNTKMANGERYYYGLSQGESPLNSELNLYPDKRKIVITKKPGIDCFQIQGDHDIYRGHCISSKEILASNVIKSKIIWFRPKTGDMILKHGTRCVKINDLKEDLLKLEEEILFENINENKENGFGIIIDNPTKNTIGCAIFLMNDENTASHKYGSKQGKVYWFTGLSSSGKTTFAKKFMESFSIKPVLLEADEIRTYVNYDLGYNPGDLLKNVDKIAGIARILSRQGFDVVVTCVSKFSEQRRKIREMIGKENYSEIYLRCDPDTRKKRDSKGLFNALSGKLISDYEEGTADITLDTSFTPYEDNFKELLKLKEEKIR
jgi:bifunctional enzyme CysN/CysC